MDFRKGMECPNCGKKSPFRGGYFGACVNSTNFNCDCGFSAVLLINWKQEWEGFEIKGIRAASNNEFDLTPGGTYDNKKKVRRP